MTIFKILLLIAGFYYLIRFLTRYFIYAFLKEKNQEKKSEGDYRFRKKTRKGNIFVHDSSRKKKHFNKNQGEYVDYEEIK